MKSSGNPKKERSSSCTRLGVVGNAKWTLANQTDDSFRNEAKAEKDEVVE